VGDAGRAAQIDVSKYVSTEVGMPTLLDIQRELGQPGRDPRSAFAATTFRDDVREMADLKPGMQLEGVVTNVTAFGAFVDVGVHQDGLVHISQLSDRFVRDPHEIVKVGDTLKVYVVEVDVARKRIALSAKAQPPSAPQAGAAPRAAAPADASKTGKAAPSQSLSSKGGADTFQNNPFAKLIKK
jgi:protein Tex